METVVDAAIRVVEALERAELPYAIGGALAYSLWSEPRTTKDVDVNVFVGDADLDRALVALHAAGVAFDDDWARREHQNGGFFHGRLGDVRVDVFTPSIPFSWEAGRTRRIGPIGNRTAWHLSAEATALFKLMFFRGKDILDLEKLVATQREKLDQAYVRRWIVEMMGEDDERTRTWDDIVRRFGHTPPTAP